MTLTDLPEVFAGTDVAESSLDELEELLFEGPERGFLATADIADGLGEGDLVCEQLEELLAELDDRGIELLEEQAAGGDAVGDEAGPDLTLETASMDSLRTYLGQIRRAALLTPSGEVALARASHAATWRPGADWSRPTCDWSCRSPSATTVAAFPFRT